MRMLEYIKKPMNPTSGQLNHLAHNLYELNVTLPFSQRYHGNIAQLLSQNRYTKEILFSDETVKAIMEHIKNYRMTKRDMSEHYKLYFDMRAMNK
jgi:hypothetical protein